MDIKKIADQYTVQGLKLFTDIIVELFQVIHYGKVTALHEMQQ